MYYHGETLKLTHYDETKNKFSFLNEGLPSLKTACAPCMLVTPSNLVIFTLHLNHVIDEHQQ